MLAGSREKKNQCVVEIWIYYYSEEGNDPFSFFVLTRDHTEEALKKEKDEQVGF